MSDKESDGRFAEALAPFVQLAAQHQLERAEEVARFLIELVGWEHVGRRVARSSSPDGRVLLLLDGALYWSGGWRRRDLAVEWHEEFHHDVRAALGGGR